MQLPLIDAAGRQLLHPRGQHRSAVRVHRQRRDALERQPYRPRRDDRRPLLHHLARGDLGIRARRHAIVHRRERDPAQLDYARTTDSHRRRRHHHEEHQAERGLHARAGEALPENERRDRSVSARWRRLGRLGLDTSRASWAHTHAALPVIDPLGHDRFRLYVSLRDEQGRARIGRTTLTMAESPGLEPLDPEPVVDLGPLGAFDDSGVTTSCLVATGRTRLLYYTGWSRGGTVPSYS